MDKKGGYGKPGLVKGICSSIMEEPRTLSMTSSEFEARILSWAHRQHDITALIQIGSRTQGESHYDSLSDWDFHVVTTHPKKYYGTNWLSEIAPPWCASAERSRRGSMKVSAVFENGLEADFIPLADWQMRLVYWGMRYPEFKQLMPNRLRHGILEIRTILTNSGYKILIGRGDWEQRLSSLDYPWPLPQMSESEFARRCAIFWQQSVWVTKKILRPELRSAMHWMHKNILENVYALLEEESWLSGRKARPDSLKAEKWLSGLRLAQTSIESSLDQRVLARAMLSQIELFVEISEGISKKRGFVLRDYTPVIGWLRGELSVIVNLNPVGPNSSQEKSP